MTKDLRIGVRLSPEEKSEIDQLIQEGKFESISQVVRVALRNYLADSG